LRRRARCLLIANDIIAHDLVLEALGDGRARIDGQRFTLVLVDKDEAGRWRDERV
jgi:hypothetical protein